MYLSAEDIARMEGVRKVHFLNPDAVRINKSLGDATGLKRLGAHMISIAPGHHSSEMHAHHQEEECIFVVSGYGTAHLGERSVRIGPGDFIGCPTDGTAHQLVNTGDVPLVCLVVGQRLPFDISDYPRLGKRLYRHDDQWDVVSISQIEHPQRGVHAKAAAPAPAPVQLRLVDILADGRPAVDTGPLSDAARGACLASASLYNSVGFTPPWIGYLCVVDGACVGTCAFKSAPRNNQVEIAYFTFPDHEGRGYATAMGQALIDIARAQVPGIVIVALTQPEETASTKVLRKLGLRLMGRVRHPVDGEVWEWELPAQG